MSGRFFSAPLLMSTALILDGLAFESTRTKAVLLGLTVALGLASTTPTFARGPSCTSPRLGINRIQDERCFYYDGANLLQWIRDVPRPPHPWATEGRIWREQYAGRVVLHSAIGYRGYFAGPGVHILDVMSLADPLLARLPTESLSDWGIGHFPRKVPEGYFESLQSDENLLVDPDLARFYDKIRLITRGDLFDPERLRAIWELNTGQYSHWLNAYLARTLEDPTSAPGN